MCLLCGKMESKCVVDGPAEIGIYFPDFQFIYASVLIHSIFLESEKIKHVGIGHQTMNIIHFVYKIFQHRCSCLAIRLAQERAAALSVGNNGLAWHKRHIAHSV